MRMWGLLTWLVILVAAAIGPAQDRTTTRQETIFRSQKDEANGSYGKTDAPVRSMRCV